MKKIPSLFVRDYEKIITVFDPSHVSLNSDGSYGMGGRATYKKGRFLATEQITPGCEWVLNGEGIATRKWDGTAVMIQDSVLYKRYDCKKGKTPPVGFMSCQEPDEITGHWPGWVVTDRGPKSEDVYILQAYINLLNSMAGEPEDGTYEAIGPKINGNNDRRPVHMLVKHGKDKIFTWENEPRSFESIQIMIKCLNIEGIVYHHPDGRMCKVKRSDFGFKWPV